MGNSGGNVVNQGRNAENRGGNAGNRSGNAGNAGNWVEMRKTRVRMWGIGVVMQGIE